jgi:hypothetical protein
MVAHVLGRARPTTNTRVPRQPSRLSGRGPLGAGGAGPAAGLFDAHRCGRSSIESSRAARLARAGSARCAQSGSARTADLSIGAEWAAEGLTPVNHPGRSGCRSRTARSDRHGGDRGHRVGLRARTEVLRARLRLGVNTPIAVFDCDRCAHPAPSRRPRLEESEIGLAEAVARELGWASTPRAWAEDGMRLAQRGALLRPRRS